MRPSSLSLRSDLAAASLLLALSLLYFRAGLGPGDQVLSHAGGDTRATFFYWRHFAARHIADGVVPLWNPYIFCGMPFIASLYAALFYPPNVVFLLLPTAAAINASIILHNFLAGVFMCALGRGLGMSRWGALASAVVFMFGAPHALHVFPGHLDALCTMAWTPLAFLVVEKWCATAHWRFVPLGGLVLGVQILAGQMQYFYYSCIGVSLYFVWRAASESLREARSAGFSLPPAPREQTDPPVADCTPELGTSRRLGTCGRLTLAAKLAVGFGLMMALGVLCAAPQFLPALEMSRLSARQHLSYDFCASFSLPPENLITFLMPTFFGDMVRLPYWGKCYFWEMTAYVGILPLALALLAVRGRKAWPFVALASVAVILALGKHTPVFAFLHGYAPGFKLFRGTSKFIFIALLALAALSGLGLDALLGQRQSTPSRRIRTLGLALLASCAVCLLVFTVLLSVDGGRLSWWRLMLYGEASVERYDEAAITMLKSDEIKQSSFAHARGNLLRLGILFGASGLVVLRPRKSLALALILGDLFWFGARLVPTFETRHLGLGPELAWQILADDPYGRVAGPVARNEGMLHEIAALGGYDPNPPARYNELINASEGQPLDHPNTVMTIRRASPVTEMLGLRYVILPLASVPPAEASRAVRSSRGFGLFSVSPSAPRAFAVQRARRLGGREAILRELLSAGFDPAAEAIIEGDPDVSLTPPASPQASQPVKIGYYSPNRVELRAARGPAALAVLTDVAYPGWRAYVDGVRRKVLTANYVLRAVALPPEAERVEFIYAPASFRIGLATALAALLGLAALGSVKAFRVALGGWRFHGHDTTA